MSSGEWSGGQYIVLRATDHDAAGFKKGDVAGKPIQQGKWYVTEGDYVFLTGPIDSRQEAIEALIDHIRKNAATEGTTP